MSSTITSGAPVFAGESAWRQSLSGRATLSVAASVLVAVCAHFSFLIPFTPVPVTLQPFAVIVVGMVLGPLLGFTALALYLLEGALGLPVFSPHGVGGVVQLLGPTGGYLFSFPLVAAVAGASVRVLRRVMPSFPAALGAGLLAAVPNFALGAAWLGLVLHAGFGRVIRVGVVPFLGPEILTLFAAAAAFSALSLARDRRGKI